MVPQIDAGEVPCPVCQGTEARSQTAIPQPNLDEDEIMTACDYPGEAAEAIASYRRCSFAEALVLVEAWIKGQ